MRLLSLALGTMLAGSVWSLSLAAPAPRPSLTTLSSPNFNAPGDFLISDQFNNRVIEVERTGRIVWQFGLGPNDVSAASPVGVNDAIRVGNLTLISGTGAPPGTEPACPSGCADNRVFLVNQQGQIVWQYGTFGVTGAGPNQLNTPVQATTTTHHTVLITDQGNQRVIEVNVLKQIIWQYGQTGHAGNGPDALNNPNSVELLPNGNLLIADENNNRAIIVNRNHAVVATFTAGGTLNGVAFASQLQNGDVLVTDSNNNRVVEVNTSDHIVWAVSTNRQPGSNPNPLPTRAVRLIGGDTLISDQFNHRVTIVDRSGALIRQFGNLNVPGYGPSSTVQGMNGPYDAKAIGDYTGLTPVGTFP